MTKYRCKLCDNDDQFVSENFDVVGEHILADHNEDEVFDFVVKHGVGIEVVNNE